MTPPLDPAEALIASLRAAAHVAIDAGDEAVAVTLTRLIEERVRAAARRPLAGVSSLDAARQRRRTRGK
jgi:hypothetical protein